MRPDGPVVRFENVVARALGGAVTGGVAVDFAAPDLATTGTARAEEVNLSELPPGLLPAGVSATGPATASGRFDLRFPVVEAAPEDAGNADPCLPRRGVRWESATGEAAVEGPVVALPTGGELALERAAGGFDVAGDVLTVRDAEVLAAGSDGRVGGGGTLDLAAPHAFQTRLRWDAWPADALTAAAFPDAPGLAAPDGATPGTVGGTAAASGTLVPFEVATADGLLRARDVRLPRPGGGVLEVAAADAEFDLSADALRVRSLKVDAGGGSLAGSATLGRAAPRAFEADLSAEAFPLATLGGFVGDPAAFGGTVALTLDARGTLEPADVSGSLTLSGGDLVALGVNVDSLAAEADAAGDTVTVRRFTATLGGAAAAGAARVRLAGETPWTAAANLTGADPAALADRLAPVLPASAADGLRRVSGAVTAALTAKGRLGAGDLSATAAVTAPPAAGAGPRGGGRGRPAGRRGRGRDVREDRRRPRPGGGDVLHRDPRRRGPAGERGDPPGPRGRRGAVRRRGTGRTGR